MLLKLFYDGKGVVRTGCIQGVQITTLRMCRTSASLGRLQSCTSWEYRLAFLWEHMLILAKN